MHQPDQLETILSKKVLQRWHLTNIFLLVISFMVPIFYEAPEEDGLLSGPNSLWAFMLSYGFAALLHTPNTVAETLPKLGLLRALLFNSYWVFISTGSIFLLIYIGLKSILCFKRWQWGFQLRFWLLGLSCLWAIVFGWSSRQNNSVLWGFKFLVCAIVLAVLWEGVNYILYRHKS